MNFVNPPAESPQHVTHKTFYSQVLNHEIGYNIYLPPGTKTAAKNIRLRTIFTDGRATNLPRYGRWKRSIKTDEPLLFLSTPFRRKTIISMPYCKLNPSLLRN